LDSATRQLTYLAALDVREWCEQKQKKAPPFTYNENLAGMCAVASAKLFKSLETLNIKAEIAANHNHVFLVVDGHVVDVTSTQFHRDEKIIILPEIVTEGYYYWKANRKFCTLDELLVYQRQNYWPDYQQPKPAILECE
jgi:hypothetical protein